MMMASVRAQRVKKVIQVITLLLLVDVGYLIYNFQSSTPGPGKPWTSASRVTFKTLEKFIKMDQIVTRAQAYGIINPLNLQAIRSNLANNQQNITKAALFLKTHKTGSSTIQNILLRKAILYNLSIALPAYKASFFWPLKFSSINFVKQRREAERYQIFSHHAVFNKPEMTKIMEKNAAFITILREPVSLFRSAFKYYNMEKLCFNTSVDKIVSSPNYAILKRGICPKTKTPIRNLQAFDLGLDLQHMEDKSAINALIDEINRTMHLVLITERFDESLILLKKKFRWTLDDVVYFKQNAQNAEGDGVSRKLRKSADSDILDFNRADSLIYNFFLQRLERELNQQFTNEELEQELSALNRLQRSYIERCVHTRANTSSNYFKKKEYYIFRPYGSSTMGYVLRPEAINDVKCRLMAMPELTITHYLKGVRFGATSKPKLLHGSRETTTA